MTPQDEERARRAVAAMKDDAANAAFLDMHRKLREAEAEIAELKRRLALAMWEVCVEGIDKHQVWCRERWVLPYRRAVKTALREREKRG